MKKRFMRVLAFAAIVVVCAVVTQAADWWASEVISSGRLGNSPYNDPEAVLGKPTVWMNNSGAPSDPDPCAVSMVIPAWNVGWPAEEKLITTIKAKSPTEPAGHITVKFDTRIYDDPNNWYGKDFIVFGNSFFAAGGSYVYSDSNMADVVMAAYEGSGWWEPSPVSVSQDGVTWYSFSNGPYADDYAPTQALAWDWVEQCWLKNSSDAEVELDFTRPTPPVYDKADFNGKSAAEGIDLYRGSGGGTAFDLAELPLPADPITGRKWIQYIKVDGVNGEVDAFARVSRQIDNIPIGAAKKLPDGTRVALKEAVVSSATYEVGRFCYVEHSDRSGGIKVMGRVLERNKRYVIYGDMDTIGNERVILATAVTLVEDNTDAVAPLGMPNKSVYGSGLHTTGLLVRTWGRTLSVDQTDKSFVIDDGSGRHIKCIAPKTTPPYYNAANPGDPDWGVTVNSSFVPPAVDHFVAVTGISSIEPDGLGGFIAVIRLRNGGDVQSCNH